MKRSGNRLVLLTAALVLLIWALTGCGGAPYGGRPGGGGGVRGGIPGHPAPARPRGLRAAECWSD